MKLKYLIIIFAFIFSLNLLTAFTISGNFNITPENVIHPPQSGDAGSGGGGSGGGRLTNKSIEKPCVSSWTCTKWEECIETTQNKSIQNRACTDTNECEEPFIKLETRECQRNIIEEIPKRIGQIDRKIDEIPQLPVWIIILIILAALVIRRKIKDIQEEKEKNKSLGFGKKQ